MSFKRNDLGMNRSDNYHTQEDIEHNTHSPQSSLDQLQKLVAYPRSKQSEGIRQYGTDYITYKRIQSETVQNNWGVAVKILSVIIMIAAVIKFGYDATQIVTSFLRENDEDKDVIGFIHDNSLFFEGISQVALGTVSLISDILIFIQGIYGIITVNK